MTREEDVALMLMMHKNKKSRHCGFVYEREVIQRERQEAHTGLMRSSLVHVQNIQSDTFATGLGCLRICSMTWPTV